MDRQPPSSAAAAVVDCAVYVGPCRRRRMIDSYDGPMRRFIDPLGGAEHMAPWELEPNRVAVRSCVKKISELTTGLTPGDRRKLREIYFAVKEAESLADDTKDGMMGDAARSLGKSMRIFKSEMKEMKDDDKKDGDTAK